VIRQSDADQKPAKKLSYGEPKIHKNSNDG